MLKQLFGRRRVLAGGTGTLALGGAAAMAQEAAEVIVDHHDFAPRELRVKAGTTVTWRNRDATPHNVVSTDTPRGFRSRIMNTNESFAFTFAAAGSFPYYCALHPQMVGRVIVE